MLFVSEPVRRLLGLSPLADRKFDSVHFYFAGGLPMKIAAAILVAGAVWFGWCYLRDGSRPSLAIKIPLLLLRLIALASLLAMLMQPMLRVQRAESQKSSVVVLVDESRSMDLKDPRLKPDQSARLARAAGEPAAGKTRAELLEKMVRKAKLVPELASRYNLRVYRFAADSRAVDIPTDKNKLQSFRLDIKPNDKTGASTQIGGAIRRAVDDLAGQPVVGALLLTDGGNNLGEDPVASAARGKQQGVRLSAIGIGDPTPTKDINITEVLADRVVRKDGIAEVYAGVTQRGYAGRTIQITLRRGGETMSKSLKLGPDGRRQTVSFTYTPKQTGTLSCTVSTPVVDGEVASNNNSRGFIQTVVGKKLKILYVEAEPRWEYRYLKNAILRDTQIKFSCILTTAGKRTGGEGNVPIYAFPPDEKSLFEFDILILGDVPRAYFSDAEMRNIRRFVEDKGGSLIVIGGEKHVPHEYKGTSLEAVLPVEFSGVAEGIRTTEPFKFEITPAGRADPILRLSEDLGENARFWSDLPGVFWCVGVERATPGATVLAVNPVRTNAYGKRVLLAVQSFGAGRCYFSAVDSTWRWRWKVGDRHFYRYWGQLLRAMTPHEPPGGNQFAQVNTDRSEYALGDRVSVHARLLDAFYRPIKAKRIQAQLRLQTGGTQPVSLDQVPGSPGLFSAEFLADRLGKFDLVVPKQDAAAGESSATFLVQSQSLEQQQPEMNEALLKQITVAGGGKYYQPDEIGKWMDSLKAGEIKLKSESEIELWDAPIFLVLFIAPLTLEWLVRKRTGLL